MRDRMTGKGLQRIPILNQSGAVVYVIHQSTIDSFASSVNKNPQDDQAFTETMAALLSDPTYEAAAEAIGVVGPNAVLAEARTAMRSVPRCNDVFLTTSGRRDGSGAGLVDQHRYGREQVGRSPPRSPPCSPPSWQGQAALRERFEPVLRAASTEEEG